MGKLKELLIEESVNIPSEDLMLMGYSRSESEALRAGAGANNQFSRSRRLELDGLRIDDLLALLEELKGDIGNAEIFLCGQNMGFVHITEGKSTAAINFDISGLDVYYEFIK